MGLFKKKEQEWHDGHGLVVCAKCGSQNMYPETAIQDDEFFIWMKCDVCDNTSASYKTCREASIDWNYRNKKLKESSKNS